MRTLSRYLLASCLLGFLACSAAAQDFNLDQSSLQFSTNAGTSPDPQQINLFNLGGSALKISIQAKTQNGGEWLSATITPNPVPGNGQAVITVKVFSSNLNVNTYNGTLVISDGTQKTNVSVQLIVSGVTISVFPTNPSLTLVQGSSGSVTVHVTGGPSALAVASNQSWLEAPGGAQAPGQFSIGVDASSLRPGSQSGIVTIQCTGGSPCLSQAVYVTADVTPSSVLRANIASLAFQAYQGRPDPPSQSFQIVSSDGSQLPFSLQTNASFLSVTQSNNTASAQPVVVAISVLTAQLNPGMNSGAITLVASNGAAPVTIPVTATLSPFSISVVPAPPLSVSVASGKMQTVPLQISTADAEPATVAVAAATGNNGTWLEAPATVNAPANINFTVDASQLVPGNYPASLTLTCSDATCDPLKVAINVTVTAGTIVPQISAVVGAGLSVPPVNNLSQDGLLTLFGTGFADASVSRNVSGSDLTNNALPTNLANTCVEGGKVRWGLIYVSATQINAVANPMATSGTIPISVIRNCGQPDSATSAPVTIKVVAEAPQFLFVVQNPSGKNEIVAIEASNGATVGPAGLVAGVTFVQAKAGDVLTSYGVGWGATSPAAVVGSLAPSGTADLTGNYKLTVGGKTANVSYAGLAPGFAGLYQMNYSVPSGLSSGDQPVVFTINGVPTPAGAFLAIK